MKHFANHRSSKKVEKTNESDDMLRTKQKKTLRKISKNLLILIFLFLPIFVCVLTTKIYAEQNRMLFEHWMSEFEKAKQKGDYATGELALNGALRYGKSEYAMGSLVWALMRQNKTNEALAAAKKMLDDIGPTAYSVASLLESALREGEMETAQKAAALARLVPQEGQIPWAIPYMQEYLRLYDSLEKGAVYELEWKIPREEFQTPGGRQLFGFPLLKTPRQTFTFEIQGANSHRIVQADEEKTIVEIRGSPRQDVIVSGRATIRAQILGQGKFRVLSEIPLTPIRNSSTGIFYYGEEAFNPKEKAIQDIVEEVRRKSAVETLQAILDWRAKEMVYSRLPDGQGSTLQRIARHRVGVCHDASYMTASLARANGIPAVVIGVMMLPKDGNFTRLECGHGHIRAQIPEVGWINLEPLNPESLCFFDGSNYLEFAVQEKKDTQFRISLQKYPVTGRRVD